MNTSLQRRLFAGVAASIIIASAAMAALSFYLAYDDANELQDTQLAQVASVIAGLDSLPSVAPFQPRDSEDAETHFVIRALGVPPVDSNPRIDLPLPVTLSPGLQSLDANGVHWRVIVARTTGGVPFGVAQRQSWRDEVARDSAMRTLVPMLGLVPVLLLIVHLLLRQGFARLAALSEEVDEVDDGRLGALDPRHVPLEALPLVLAVNRLLTRLGSALAQQRRMVADAAHELRTPVAATRVQADNLAHALPDGDARSRLEPLQRGLARISELIEQLLSLARVQLVATTVDMPVSLDAVVRSAIEEILPLAQSKGVDLGCVRLDAAHVRGDSSHVHALVRNALDNAVRYTPQGGAVDVSVAVHDDQAELTVDDTGPGIPHAQRARVFEPFFRILGSNQTGSGLGLAIVRSAAQALGGSVELCDRPDGGSGLRFTYRQAIR